MNSANRNVLFGNDIFATPKTTVSHATELDGCTMKTKETAVIDGKLSNTTIISVDDSPIKISALAVLENCIIECNDLLIEGKFTGEIKAKGSFELGDSAMLQGTVSVGGSLVVNMLADTIDMKVAHASPKKSAYAKESKDSGNQVYQIKSSDQPEIARVG